jgi:hypothetical protein
VPLAAQNALFCIHAATNIEELQSVQIECLFVSRGSVGLGREL